MPFNAGREAQLIKLAYHALLKLDKSGKRRSSARVDHGGHIKEKSSKLGEKDCLGPHGLSAILDRFTEAVAHFFTFEAVPPARAILPPSWSSVPPVRDRPPRRKTMRPPLFLQTIQRTDLIIYHNRPQT